MTTFNVKKGRFSRREFMTAAGAGTAALLSPFTITSCRQDTPSAAPDQPVSSIDRPAVGVIGVGGRGGGIAEWQFPPFADVVAICDADLRRTGPVAEEILRRTGRKVYIVHDYRDLLDRQDIQVIANATPDHWHAKIIIDACQAGKDVYCEKPLTLTVDEGKILQRMVNETGRIVGVGNQQRSAIQFQMACSLVRNGRIGRLKQIGVFLPGGNFRPGSDPCQEEPVPGELDWDLWSGQAPLHPFCEARLRFRSWYDYGGGGITDWGAHHMDIAMWGMGNEISGPLSIEAKGYCPNLGTPPNYPDQFQQFAARMEFSGGIELWFLKTPPEPAENEAYSELIEEIYGMVPENIRNFELPDQESGVLFIGESGSIYVSRAGAYGEGIGEFEQIPLVENGHMRWRSTMYEHTGNFISCVGSRNQPRCTVAEMHKTVIPCHLTNIALRLERKLNWDPDKEEFIDDSEANTCLKREQREPYRIA